MMIIKQPILFIVFSIYLTYYTFIFNAILTNLHDWPFNSNYG